MNACEILKAINKLAAEMEERGAKFPCAKRIHVFAISSIVIGATVLVLYALVSVDGHCGATLGDGPGAFLFSRADIQFQASAQAGWVGGWPGCSRHLVAYLVVFSPVVCCTPTHRLLGPAFLVIDSGFT